MVLAPRHAEPARTVGHVPHDAQVRLDKRVTKILARQQAAMRQGPPRRASPPGSLTSSETPGATTRRPPS
jgi:hypothetical protein